MKLSKELQVGKAGEHFVCYDLITKGFNAFLADQGLPYDIIVEVGGALKKMQVKTCSKATKYDKSPSVRYRFFLLSGKGGRRRVEKDMVDYFAFVALDIKVVAYFPKEDLIAKDDKTLKKVIELRSSSVKNNYKWNSRQLKWKHIEYYNKFPPDS